MIIAVYVDDFLVYGAKKKEINSIQDTFKAKFHMSNLKPISFYFGIAVLRVRTNRILCLSQEAYLKKIF